LEVAPFRSTVQQDAPSAIIIIRTTFISGTRSTADLPPPTFPCVIDTFCACDSHQHPTTHTTCTTNQPPEPGFPPRQGVNIYEALLVLAVVTHFYFHFFFANAARDTNLFRSIYTRGLDVDSVGARSREDGMLGTGILMLSSPHATFSARKFELLSLATFFSDHKFPCSYFSSP